ncbi:cupin domain-containing protein [Dyadobacter sandarakinus]|uniref:Cupin domain-containing protein n=1 Tax=Dyadobacter sandarakinus TaxID=2747268 RepID=A0ABX7IAF6_9BACT|nr:cupin domain-containing protein [Dyadobacter sandarakinus]QRR02698.1 cupin domain-containing protein [Dyadobacter sandarakinus]
MKPATFWVNHYNLLPHPEGGYYTESYRASEVVAHQALPGRFSGDRVYSTGIYFLLETHDFSAFHRIKSDEMWHFYAGGALEIFVINPDTGALQVIRLGNEPGREEVFQAVVPAGSWFASRPAEGTVYALVGCTVAPGFDFADFEMAQSAALVQDFPRHAALIEVLTRS